MVKDVTKFHNIIWGLGMLECVCVCVCVQGFIQNFELLFFWRGGIPKFGVDVEVVYST